MLNALKRKPIVLIILPIVFLIEFFLRPFVTNLSFDQLSSIYYQLSIKSYDNLLFDYCIIFIKSIIALILFCVLLRFLYKTISFKDYQNRSINNSPAKDFIKTFFAGLGISFVTSLIMFLLFIVVYKTPYSSIRTEYFQSKLIIFLDSLIFTWVPALLACFIISLSVYFNQNGFGLVNTFKKTLKTFQRKSLFVILLIAIISSLSSTAIRVYKDEMSNYYHANKQTYNYGEISKNFLERMIKPGHRPVDEPANILSSDVDISEVVKQILEDAEEETFDANELFNQKIEYAIWMVPLWMVGFEAFVRSLFIVYLLIYSAIIASKTLESNNNNNSSGKDFKEVSL